VKKCSWINFFKLVHYFLKFMAYVNITQSKSSISSLECLQFVSVMQDFFCLFSHSPFARLPIHMFCQLFFSIVFPMLWFLINVRGGVTKCHFLDIPKVLLSSHVYYLICPRLLYIQSLIPMCLVWKLVAIFLLPL